MSEHKKFYYLPPTLPVSCQPLHECPIYPLPQYHPSLLWAIDPHQGLPPDEGVPLHASYHCILKGLQVRSDDPNSPPLIFGDVLEEGANHRWMIEEIVQSQAPNKVLMETPPPPFQYTQPKNCCPSLTEVPSPRSNLVTAQGSSHHTLSVGWADDPTCPDGRSTNLTVAQLFSCPTHPTDLARDAQIVSALAVLANFKVSVSAPANFQNHQPIPILYYFVYMIEKY